MKITFTDSDSLHFAPQGEIPIPFRDDLVLILGPWLWMPLLLLIPLVLIVCLYNYETRLITKGTAAGLLCLRILVLLVIWGLICFQPAFVHTRKYEVPGKVLVMMDVSESMDVSDPQRTDAEKLELALALNMTEGFPSDVVNAQLIQEWAKQHREKKDIKWIKDNEHRDDQIKRGELADQREEAHDQLLKRVEKLTRLEVARRLLMDPKSANLRQQILEQDHQIEARSFSRDIEALDLPKWNKQMLAKKKKKETTKDNGKGGEEIQEKVKQQAQLSRHASTDLNLPLLHATQWSTAEQGEILGVILLTEGRHNGNQPIQRQLAKQMRRYRDGKEEIVPFYPIALGSKDRPAPPDVSVLALDMPTTVFKDVDITVQTRFRITGMPKQKMKIQLFREGEDKPIKEREIEHDPAEDEHSRDYYESFSIRLDKEGTKAFKVKITPLGPEAEGADPKKVVKESDLKNNELSTLVNVAKDQADVLVIDGEARWEFHYLYNALLRDGSMKVKGVVFIQPRLGNVTQGDLDRMDYPALLLPPIDEDEKKEKDDKEKKPADAKEGEKKEEQLDDPLYKYDCIILGDVLPELLKREDRERLERYVADRGGTLVILAGKRGMPMRYLLEDGKKKPAEDEEDAAKKLEEKAEEDPLLRMLPIAKTREFKTSSGFHVSLTEQGKRRPYLQMEPDSTTGQNLARWADFHPHYWAVLGEAKEGATPLAYVRGEEKDLDPTEIRKRERKNALIVAHNYGFGEVLYVGVDSTWRWRYRIGDNYHHRFWGQTIRWAASDKPLIAGNKLVRFGTPKPIYRHNESVDVLVRLEQAARTLTDQQKKLARARIYRKIAPKDGEDKKPKEELAAYVKLTPKAFQPRLYKSQIPELPPGDYEIELDIPALDGDLKRDNPKEGESEKIRAKFMVAGRDDRERTELSSDHDLLKDLATENGSGKVYYPEEVAELAKKLKSRTFPKEDPNETKLWLWWPMLVLILLLLTIEWVTRKLAGLP